MTLKNIISKVRSKIYWSIFGKQEKEIGNLKKRLSVLENRLFNPYRNRWDAIDNLIDYLFVAEVDGDYCEFGVYKGNTFSYAVKVLGWALKNMRFFAFDSFEGLPEIKGLDNENGYAGGYHEGEFATDEEEFLSFLKINGTPLDRVVTIKGWFNKTLTPKTAKEHKINAIAAAWIDCDLYESTVPVLDFLTDKLSVGSVLLFDDWHCFRNLPNYGEQRACQEWLDKNPQITLLPLLSFGFHGEAFTVGSC
jgi:O-methyltransferase